MGLRDLLANTLFLPHRELKGGWAEDGKHIKNTATLREIKYKDHPEMCIVHIQNNLSSGDSFVTN